MEDQLKLQFAIFLSVEVKQVEKNLAQADHHTISYPVHAR